ncbi:hypothetical protein, variant [Aphanomyces astaci]|uniref:Transcription initiation factor TFIID subunit 9B n=2 Tax=Aphanomyces astaci TaxID=112090 RepID=W4FUK8_APHAT|nr:hypothetical protein, variant [Aphanomyces astaci]ETV71180.1 hypothetical protein, variant [Aphanomyces astaci]RHY10677.1 hypothetical protein DYB25_007906 [Aphanomyces astaci]RHY55189.1 hypothetical protein DYB30_001879 [Aphanomyces astaci]RHY63777.1 hypothetical protein DYB38_001528 [Aphanomyces astaci]RHY78288.1 hypothetical protein DYB34_002813 [Aphanomyces astaci]|eukprot:XP_009839426.1 hypothetical protein, variant [Aphanomyces astaci]
MSDPKEVPREKTPKKQKTSNNAASTAAASGSATTDEEVYDMHAMAKDTQEPEDVAVLKWILGSMGVDKYEPRVIPQLLEFVHRYTSEILVDAQEYSTFANKPAIDADDIRLAAASRLKHTYAQIPSRELMMELAEKRNALPLPPIPSEYGVRLPPVEHQLTAENIRLYPNHHPSQLQPPTATTVPLPLHGAYSGMSLHPPTSAKGTRNIKISSTPIQINLATTSTY